jgi:Glycosyl transferases group 1
MEKITKPRLVFFQFKHEGVAKFIQLHMQLHVKCLSEFFDVIVINEDCNYQQICDKYQPDLTLFESGVNYRSSHRLEIKNIHANPEIPKLGLHNGDPWCEARAGLVSDMENWGIETIFCIATTTAEHTPEIAENLFVWPNFIDSDIYQDYGYEKIIPVLFTGSQVPLLYAWRQKIFKIVSESYPSLICPHHGYGKQSASRMIYGEQYARTINASWVVPTCGTIAKEIVRKHFEIPAAKSCLITEKTPSLEAAGFVDMENCVFADETDILDKLDYLFQNLDDLGKITNAGYQLVHSRHTLKQRDQISQWFHFFQTLKPNQKIIQTNPFEPLTIVDKSLKISNSHIICNGLEIQLLDEGDKMLRSGKYDEAEVLYLKCHNYISWMPEPKLKMALCNLYKGNAENAIYWILQPIKYTLEEYKSVEPDPIEWAYFIISLLCQGRLDQATENANKFPSLYHPELERIRWVIKIFNNEMYEVNVPSSELSKARSSIHQLPKLQLNDWIDNLCLIFKACKQFNLAEILSKSFLSEQHSNPSDRTKLPSKNSFNKIPILQTKSNLSILLKRSIASKLRRQVTKPLHYLESRFGFFLPYQFSQMKDDEFFSSIQKLVREEDIKTVLVIGASSGEGSTEAILTGAKENRNKPTVVCINITVPRFIKLQKLYANNSVVKCYDFPSMSVEDYSDECDTHIKKIKQKNKINSFDVILINCCKLNFITELDDVYGANFVLIDAINNPQNYKNYSRLLADANYTIVTQNLSLRDGYAIFKKVILTAKTKGVV